MGTFPVVTVGLAVTTDPLAASPSFTDMSTSVMSGKTVRGRRNLLDRTSPGTTELVIDDRTLQLDPFNTASALYPNVKPRKKLQVSCVYNAVTYYLSTAFMNSAKPRWMKPSYTEVSVRATDGFSILNARLPADSYPSELTSARIARVLDAVGWPSGSGHRQLDTGIIPVPALTVEDGQTVALQHLLDVAASEVGVFFMDAQGRATFHNRTHRFDAPADYAPVATVGDGGGSELDWETLDPDYDDEGIVNEWTVTPAGGTAVVATDAASVTAYGPISGSRDTLVESADDARYVADYFLSRTKDPVARIDGLTIEPSKIKNGTLKDNLYAFCLGAEIGQRITVKGRPPGAAYAWTQDCWIEGVAHEFSDQHWVTTLQLSSVDATLAAGLGYWILGDATYGQLGISTRLAPL